VKEAPGFTEVEMRGITKTFPGVIANKAVDLDLLGGEVHALLGENGAGKTTLMRILAGVYRPDSGKILIHNRPVAFDSPGQAIRAGVGMVHQEFRLVEALTVAENIHLGWDQAPRAFFSKSTLIRRTREICTHFGLQIDPCAEVWQLSTGEQQRVEILRVLSRGARILILDEPTSVLTPQEARELFRVIRVLASEGRTVVFISHKLEEVLAISDRVTVLRGGCKLATKPTVDCDERSLARLMIGQDLISEQRARDTLAGEKILSAEHVCARNDRGLPALVDVNLTINGGEIVGVAGVAGNGQRELAEVLTGLRPVEKGKISIQNLELTGKSSAQFVQAGVGHIPEDRTGTGLVSLESITHNAILREYRQPPISRGPWLDSRAADRFAMRLVEEAGISVPSVQSPVGQLSGGTMQRLLTRREIRVGSRLLVAVHPTRGLDVGATEAVRKVLLDHRRRGVAVLLISEDLDELEIVSDRIVVLYCGRIAGEFEAGSIDREAVGLLMGGSTKGLESAA
jgi:simple sugar transport system ATP-binding protein